MVDSLEMITKSIVRFSGRRGGFARLGGGSDYHIVTIYYHNNTVIAIPFFITGSPQSRVKSRSDSLALAGMRGKRDA
jgi:hypothetical protein